MGSQGQAYKIFSLFDCSFIVFLELGLEEAAPHFEAELCSTRTTSPQSGWMRYDSRYSQQRRHQGVFQEI